MADNIAVTAGTGTTIATEDEGGVHYQKVKLTSSGSGTTQDLSVAEDAVHSSGQHGILAIAVRNDTLATLADTDGDNAPLQVDADGALYVTLNGESLTVASHAVTNAGTFAVQVDGNALTALQLIDDAVYVDDADWTDSTSKHLLVGGLYQSTPQTITDGDVGPLALDSTGNLRITGTVTANLSATDNAVLDNIQTSVDTLAAAVSTEVQVDVVGALPAGTNAIGKLAANSGVDIGDVDVTSTVHPAGAGAIASDRQTVTTAGTAVQLQSHACKFVILTAESDNTGAIWVGDSNVVAAAGSQQGFILYTGQTSPMLPISNSNLLYIDSEQDGDGVGYVYIT